MSDAILACDQCWEVEKLAIPLRVDPAGVAWCPRCGKQWEDLDDVKEREVERPDSDTVGPLVCAGPCTPEGSE